MAQLPSSAPLRARPRPDDAITDLAAAEDYLARICFKTGPPRWTGVELEWTVHHRDDPTLPLDLAAFAAALGEHVPSAVCADSSHSPLPNGAVVTVEPGGQVELSTPPRRSVAELVTSVRADIAELDRLLAQAGLVRGDEGCDPHRPPTRLLDSPRYAAMERAFDQIGPHGRSMMCGTAGLQICLDAGLPQRAAARWQALHTIGPALLAMFANSPQQAGRSTGWASSRMRTWYGTDPVRTAAPRQDCDPVRQWARRVLHTSLLCLRRPDGCWDAPAVTFAEWIEGSLRPVPSFDDLDYHLSTMFAPVRARGYFEVRYLDTQPGDGWLLPLAMLAALFAREETVDAATRIARPVQDGWIAAARDGLTDPRLRRAAESLTQLAVGALQHLELTPDDTAAVVAGLAERFSSSGGDTERNSIDPTDSGQSRRAADPRTRPQPRLDRRGGRR